jgi:hypothetical protein
MVYRRTVSINEHRAVAVESFTFAVSGTAADAGSSKPTKPTKRRRPHDEEQEMSLFRHVRIKTELNDPRASALGPSPSPPRRSEDPYSDPDLRRVVEAEAEGEEQKMPTQFQQQHFGLRPPATFTTGLLSFAGTADQIEQAELDLVWAEAEAELEEEAELRRDAQVEEALNKRELEVELSYYDDESSESDERSDDEMMDLDYEDPGGSAL